METKSKLTFTKQYILPLLLLLLIVCQQIISFFPHLVERYYSTSFYQIIASFLRVLLGKVSFSVGDILYGIVLFCVMIRFWKVRKTWKSTWKIKILKIVSGISVFYLLFTFLWGFNYLRIPLYEKLEIDKEYTLDELELFTMELIQKTNSLHSIITPNSIEKIVVPHSIENIYQKGISSYQNLAHKHTFFNYKNESIKSSLISVPLSYMGFSGYLNPFTNEAQINCKIPKYQIPITTCHEMAHQIGFASESEANFIGFLATIHSDDLYFQYSGYSFALRYCINTLEKIEKGSSEKFLSLIYPGILENYKESKEFWESHQTVLEPIFTVFYDNFLKINQQKDGMEGYSKFVGLMIGYFRQNNFKL